MKVLVEVPLTPYTGYGNDGIGIVRALLRWGADVYLQAPVVQAPLPPDVAALFLKTAEAPFDLAIVHLNPSEMKAPDVLRANADVVIGWTMWEATNFKNLKGRSQLKKQWKNFDAIVAYDEVSKTAIQEYYSGPVPIVQGGFWSEDWPEMERDYYADEFNYCMLGVLTDRKDPFVAIQAFKELKEEKGEAFAGARLNLKTTAPGLHSAMEKVWPWLRVYYEIWNDKQIRNFYASQHVLLAPSRGEGKNMPALEFQSTGGTVIATNWGGHRQWLDPSYNYALDYTLEPVTPYFPDTLNARASVAHLKELIWDTFQNRDLTRNKAQTAAHIIPGLASWDNVLERFLLRVTDSVDKTKGQKLWTVATMARQDTKHADD